MTIYAEQTAQHVGAKRSVAYVRECACVRVRVSCSHTSRIERTGTRAAVAVAVTQLDRVLTHERESSA